MTNDESIISFLAYFNQIDKHLDKVLGDDGFAPYNEKLKKVAEGRFSITNFIRKHIYQLRNMGELRNFITHGIKTNGETYAIPTQAALEKIQHYAEIIIEPPTVGQVFRKEVFTAKITDKISELIPLMKKHSYTHIPIYDEKWGFVGVLSESRLLHWVADAILENNYANFELLQVQHCPLDQESDFIFVSKEMSIYEADLYFTEKKLKNQKFDVMFITEMGDQDSQILGMITSSDANVIDQYLLL